MAIVTEHTLASIDYAYRYIQYDSNLFSQFITSRKPIQTPSNQDTIPYYYIDLIIIHLQHFFLQQPKSSETSHACRNLEWEVHHVQAQAFHHQCLHETARSWCLTEVATSGFEGTRRDRNDGDVLTVAELDHVPIWVMEEHLVDLDPIVLYHCSNIPHPHLLQLPLNKSNISALHVQNHSQHLCQYQNMIAICLTSTAEN